MTAAMTRDEGKTVGHQFAPWTEFWPGLGRSAFLQLRQRQIRHDALPLLAR